MHLLSSQWLSNSYVLHTLFLHEVTVYLFYYIEETRHNLRVSHQKIVDGLRREHQLLRQAGLGSNHKPSQGYFEAISIRYVPGGAAVRITDDMWKIPDTAILTQQGLSILEWLSLSCMGEVSILKRLPGQRLRNGRITALKERWWMFYIQAIVHHILPWADIDD